jgi:hypothetical protein
VTRWRDPQISLPSLAILIIGCLKFDAEKIAAFPLLLFAWYMVLKFRKRVKGTFENEYLDAELKKISRIRSEYTDTYQPIAQLKISVPRGKNIRSRDLGLPGKSYCTVCFDPYRFRDESAAASTDDTLYEIGSTCTSKTTQNPAWDEAGRVHNRKLSALGSEWKGLSMPMPVDGGDEAQAAKWGKAILQGADASSVGGSAVKKTRSGMCVCA